jgi:2-octaprenyl-6-methoxyphenol hydroxylase
LGFGGFVAAPQGFVILGQQVLVTLGQVAFESRFDGFNRKFRDGGHQRARLGRLRAAGPLARFPLELVRARRLYDARLALAGNVAHGLHPVAGQGLNLSLRDVAVLAGRLLTAADPGAPEVLADYAGMRAVDIDRITAATDFLARGLLAVQGFAPHALGGGMLLLDRIDPLRRLWAEQAMGLQPLPRRSLRSVPQAMTESLLRRRRDPAETGEGTA